MSGSSAADVSVSTQRIPLAMLLASLWFLGLLVVCYYPTLSHLVWQWNNDADMGHGFLVPPAALYLAWQKRDELQALPARVSFWGIAVLAFAAVQQQIGNLGAELFLSRTAFLLSVAGCVVFLQGWAWMRLLFFPWFVLFFMVPIPGVIYNQLTFPLQLFASRVAEAVLALVGLPVLRDGNVIELASQRLEVVDACSGIRSLLSLLFLAAVYSALFDRRVWMRPVLMLATIPIAVAANAGRVTLTGILSEIQPDLAHGFFHGAQGWVIFMFALGMLIAFHQLLSRMIRGRNA